MLRLSTGIPTLDKMLAGGIPRGFLVCVCGEPGTGKTIFCIHFTWKGVVNGEKCIYVTTEEDRDSVVRQASQFGMDFEGAVRNGSLIIIDALTGKKDDEWALKTLNVEDLVKKVIEAKKRLGVEWARCVIDSLSAFWLDKPAMARRYSYLIKKVFKPWRLTTLAVTQYAITTSQAFGFGLEHVGDGIIRFIKSIRGGVLKRYVLIEKMRCTPHDLYLHEVQIVDGVGMVVMPRRVEARREDLALPREVMERIVKAEESKEDMLP